MGNLFAKKARRDFRLSCTIVDDVEVLQRESLQVDPVHADLIICNQVSQKVTYAFFQIYLFSSSRMCTLYEADHIGQSSPLGGLQGGLLS